MEDRNRTLWMLCWDFFYRLSTCLPGSDHLLDDCPGSYNAAVSASDNFFHLPGPPTPVEMTTWNWRRRSRWSIPTDSID